MHLLTREEFDARFPRRPPQITYDGSYTGDLSIDRDAVLSGVVESGAKLFVREGAHLVITGRVDGTVHVDEGAVVWVEGLVDGRMYVDGAASIEATTSVKASRRAVIFDPCEPADSETG